jgi:hypothetical protein
MGGKHGGIYIRCDSCGKTIGGEECSENGLHWSQTSEMKAFARHKGWTGDLNRESSNDRCPECSSMGKS